MTRFAAPIAEQIWDMKYRMKDAEGQAVDGSVEDSWRRVARDLARGATVADRSGGFDDIHSGAHRISLCVRIWMMLKTISGVTKMNSTTASAAECP